MTYLQKLRAAQAEVNAAKEEEAQEAAKAEAEKAFQEGAKLLEVLMFLGFDFDDILLKNEYKVDGFTFYLQGEHDPYNYSTPSYRKDPKTRAVTFRLVVVKDVPLDDEIEDFRWDCSGDVVARDVTLVNAQHKTQYRAELADLLDRLNAQYEARLPQYQKLLERARQPKADPEYPQTFIYPHDHTRRDNNELTDLIQRGYRVVAMNTINNDDGEAMSYILLSRHPNPLPITLQYHEEV